MYAMISTGTNDLKRWNFRDRNYVQKSFLAGISPEAIGKTCNRHAKNVCLELIRQGLLDETIPKNHIRFDDDSDTSSEYTPSDDDSCESDDESEDGDYIDTGENDEESEDSESCESDDESEDVDFDNFNIKQNINNIFKIMNSIKNYLSIRKL